MRRKGVEGQEKQALVRTTSIWRIAVWSPTSSCKKIGIALLLKGTDAHRTTVNSRLVHDFNLKAFKPAKKTSAKPSHESEEIGLCQAI